MRPCVVFLLHGLGAHPLVMAPMQLFLRAHGFPHVFAVAYNVRTHDITSSARSASAFMLHALRAATVEEACARWDVFVVGHSWGGLVCNRLHALGWAIRGAVYLAAPLHGARILGTLHSLLPHALVTRVSRAAYDTLRHKHRERVPPHPYHTLSCGWAHTDFDGAVFRDEATLQRQFHTHVAWGSHSLMLVKPRTWRFVQGRLQRMQTLRRVSRAAAQFVRTPFMPAGGQAGTVGGAVRHVVVRPVPPLVVQGGVVRHHGGRWWSSVPTTPHPEAETRAAKPDTGLTVKTTAMSTQRAS